MPNWTYNQCKVETTDWDYENEKEVKEAKRQLDEFIKLSFKLDQEEDAVQSGADIPRKTPTLDDKIFTFQGVVPMPKSLLITSGSSTERGMAYIDLKENGKAQRIDTILNYAWAKDEIDGRWSINKQRDALCELFKKDNETWDNDLKEGRIALDNIERHGCKDWYDWSNRYWGTKWDACDSHIEDYCLDDSCEYYIQFSFNTAWCPPYEYLLSLTEKFPLIRITCSVEEESDAFMGNIICQWGKLVDNTAEVNYPERGDY